MARLVPIPGIDLESYFPLTAGEKRPFDNETGWFGHHPTRTLTPENYPKYESAGADWGLRCGVFSGLVVIDQDGAKGVALVRHLGLRSTCWAKTKRGRHDIHAVTAEQLAVLKTTVGLFDQVDLISTGAMVRAYTLSKQIAAPALTATRFGKLAARIKEKHGNGADTWEGGDIDAGARNATLNATLFKLARDNPELELQHYKLVADGLRAHMTGGMPDREFKQTSASAWNAARSGGEPDVDPFPPPMSIRKLREYIAQLPPRVPFLGPLLSAQVGIMFAPAGIGKSMFAMFLADAIARGDGLGPWDGTGIERRVLIVDGEMDGRDLDERFDLLQSLDVNVDFAMSEQWPDGGLNLAERGPQDQIFTWARDYDLVIIDNISALVLPPDGSGIDVWSPTLWQSTGPLRSWFRKKNKHLLWIDHSNAGGTLQGTMAKQRDVDYLMRLKRPEDNFEHLEFTLTWPKYRANAGASTRAVTWSLRLGEFSGVVDLTTRERIANWRKTHPGQTQANAAKDLDLTPKTVSKNWH